MIESYDYAMKDLISVTNIYVIDTGCLYEYIENIDIALSTKLNRLKSIEAALSRLFDSVASWMNFIIAKNIHLTTYCSEVE